MATIAEKIRAAKQCCLEEFDRKMERSKEFYDRFFNGKWSVFVIKRDETTGKLIGKTICCADCPA